MAIKWQNWLYGDVYVESSATDEQKANFRELRLRLAKAARWRFFTTGVRRKWCITSGYRTWEEQARLYKAYLNGTGNLAAKPGTSNHERGKAADVSVNGRPVGASWGRRRCLRKYGLCLPVTGEAWHTEIGSTWRA